MDQITRETAQTMVESVGHWHHTMEVFPGVVTPGSYDPHVILDVLPLADDLAGKRVLDLGTRDGFFAFECERRNAEVLAVDVESQDTTGFGVASTLRGSRVAYAIDNVYALTAQQYGTFDIVLFLGVLYHLRHPLLALDRLAEVCTGRIYLESQVMEDEPAPRRGLRRTISAAPVAEFWSGEFANDPTVWWVPSKAAVVDLLKASGFECSSVIPTATNRAVFVAERVRNVRNEYLRDLDAARSWPALRASAGAGLPSHGQTE